MVKRGGDLKFRCKSSDSIGKTDVKYRNQHYITEAYLKAWCDPETPNGAFVWVVSKTDRKIARRSPKSLFSEEDFYSMVDSQGNRSFDMELWLKQIEDDFILLRDKKLRLHQPLSEEDKKTIAMFVATMFTRTKREKENQKKNWQDYLTYVETLPPGVREMVKKSPEYMEVVDLNVEQPMPYHLHNFIRLTVPRLSSLNCAIYETKTKPGFITSDNPCLWIDPAIFNPYTPLTFFGIGSLTLNILFPISPELFLSLEQMGPDGYISLSDKLRSETDFIDNLNGMTLHNCEEFIVTNQNIIKDEWFV
jgi:hypothetical protein